MVESREMLGLIPHGLYLIGVQTETSRFIYTGSWLTQISFEPCLIVTAVRRTHEDALIQEARAFTDKLTVSDRLLDWKGPARPWCSTPSGCRLMGRPIDLALAEAIILRRGVAQHS